MRQRVCIAALLAFGFGMLSCEADTDVEETQALYKTMDMDATDNGKADLDDRDG